MSRHLRAALDDVQRDPRDAERVAIDALDTEEAAPSERALALWLRGRAEHELDRVADACSTLAAARSVATELSDDVLAAEISVSEAVCWMTAGDTDRSVQLLDDAAPLLAGGPLGRLVMQRGLIDLYRGELRAAAASFDDALPLLDEAGDQVARCRLLANRGVIHTQLGELAEGLADFSTCRTLAVDLDQSMIAAGAAHNLGFLFGRRSEFPEALRWFEIAQQEYAAVGFPHRAVAVLASDQCAMLLSAGLDDEALSAATRAEEAARSSGNQIAHADALLQLAQAQMSAGEPGVAATTAEHASALFRLLDREPMAVLSDYVALRAGDDASNTAARLLLAPLEQHGWVNEAQDVRLFIGEQALRTDRLGAVDDVLDDAAKARRSTSWALRAGGWYATALRRLADADREGANRALRVGVRIVEQHRATIAATDLRAHAAARSSGLINLGLQLAFAERDAGRLLDWARRAHTESSLLQSARPSGSAALNDLLADLRVASAAVAASTANGRYDAAEHRRLGELEARVRYAARTSGRDVSGITRRVGTTGFASIDSVSVVYVDVAGELCALVSDTRRDGGREGDGDGDSDRPTIVQLGPADEISHRLSHLLRALRRLATGSTDRRALDAARDDLRTLADELDRLLLEPLPLRPEASLAVLAPNSLTGMPWAVLPSLAARSFSLGVGATSSWQASGRPTVSGQRVAAVSGPGLSHADSEVRDVGRQHAESGGSTTVITGDASTVETVLDEFARADLVHIAAHGEFRRDSPMFSSLRLADGPLTVYDLEQVTMPPAIVVLSACDAGRVAMRGGGAILGTAAALLHIGVGAVVAPVVPVADEAAARLMHDLHAALAAGIDVAAALAVARTAALRRSAHVDHAAAASFVVLTGS